MAYCSLMIIGVVKEGITFGYVVVWKHSWVEVDRALALDPHIPVMINIYMYAIHNIHYVLQAMLLTIATKQYVTKPMRFFTLSLTVMNNPEPCK